MNIIKRAINSLRYRHATKETLRIATEAEAYAFGYQRAIGENPAPQGFILPLHLIEAWHDGSAAGYAARARMINDEPTRGSRPKLMRL